MSLDDYTNIDMIVRIPNDDRRVALVIFDDVMIADAKEREQLLHKKMAVYLECVASGQLVRSHTDLLGKDFFLEVVCSYTPTEYMRDLDRLRHRERPSIVLPINVVSLAEFRAKFGLSP